MRFIVFQHGECEHPGIFQRFLSEDGIQWDVVELDRGAPIPDLDRYDAMLVMGGWMEPWDDRNHPWLAAERRAIAYWVSELERPFLGVCLGHLLLADALGGKSAPLKPVEIGICEVELTPEGRADPVYAGTPARQKCLQWHSAEVSVLPPAAVVLARSDACACQAMRIGRHAYSMQYHVEIDDETIPNWGRLPDYAEALAKELGPDGLSLVTEAARPLMPEFADNARMIYRNFMSIAAAAMRKFDAEDLIRRARESVNPRQLSATVGVGDVGCALVSEKGHVYVGVSIDTACSMGFCAEHNAIGTMITNGESKILALVAVDWNGEIVSPCGRCREFIYQVDPGNADTIILLKNDRRMRLKELLPEHWALTGNDASTL